jgi:hypothetical protein
MTSNRVARQPSESWTSASNQSTATATVSSVQVRRLRNMTRRYCDCVDQPKPVRLEAITARRPALRLILVSTRPSPAPQFHSAVSGPRLLPPSAVVA